MAPTIIASGLASHLPKHRLVREGDEGREMFVIRSARSQSRNEFVSREAAQHPRPGKFFGEMSCSQEASNATAVLLTDAKMSSSIPRPSSHAARNAEISVRMIKMLADR